MPEKDPGIDEFLSLKELPPVTLLSGSHTYDRNLAIAQAKALFIRNCGPDIEIKQFSGDSIKLGEALSGLVGCGFFSTATLVILKEFPSNAESGRLFSGWLANRPDDYSVIFCADALKSNSVFLKSLRPYCKVFKFPMPDRREFGIRAAKLFKQTGLRPDPEAGELLLEAFKGDLAALESELAKISSFLGGRKTLKMEDLNKVSSARAVANIFQLVDKIAFCDRGDAMVLLERMLREGEQPQKLLAVIITEFRKILVTGELIDCGFSDEEILRKFRVRYYAQKFIEKAKAVRKRNKDGRFLKVLLDAEHEMKTSGKPPESVMESVLCELTS